MSETDLSRHIRLALERAGVWVIRIQSGTIKAGARYIHCSEPGTPDLWSPYGWLEVKVPGKKPSPHQDAWHERALRYGVNVAVVTSPKEALAAVMNWKEKASPGANQGGSCETDAPESAGSEPPRTTNRKGAVR